MLISVDHPFKRLHDTSVYQMIESHSPLLSNKPGEPSDTPAACFWGGKKLPTSNQGSHIQRLEGLTSPCCAVRNYWYNKSSSAPLILQKSNLSEEMHCMGARFFLKMQMHLNQIMLFHCHDISHQSEGSIQTGNIHQMLSIFSKHSKSLVRHGTFTRPPAIIVARP